MRISKRKLSLLIGLPLTVLMIWPTSNVQAQLPVQGMPIPALSGFDDIMQNYMADNDINAAVLGIMKDRRIVYLRSFGYKDEDLAVDIPENSIMRIASVTKPFTAAAIRKLINRGTIGLHQHVFTLEENEDGILDYEPWNGLADQRLKDITVNHLLKHKGGWDRADPIGDLTYKEVQIALEMEFDPYRLPDREETVKWIMSDSLQFDPGTDYKYSNIGYLILGLIAEKVTGTDLRTYLREEILDRSMWFPTSEFEYGRSMEALKNPREPWYNSLVMGTNVFDPYGDDIRMPYGGWNHEARTGQGAMITSAVPVLKLLANYCVHGDSIGVPISVPTYSDSHDGRMRGTEATARQRLDGVNYVILLNKRVLDDPDPPAPARMYVRELKPLLDTMISNGGFTWPTQTVDGVWMDFTHTGPEQGCYDEPFDSILDLGNVMAYSKVRFKPGSTRWTGTITRGPMALSAPEGSVVIGE